MKMPDAISQHPFSNHQESKKYVFCCKLCAHFALTIAICGLLFKQPSSQFLKIKKKLWKISIKAACHDEFNHAHLNI